MAVIRIQIKGINRLRRQFEKHPNIVGKHISLAINRTVDSIIGKTRPITPVKTGRLVGSFTTDSIRASSNRLVGAVRSLVPYAASVHDLHRPGTRYFNPSKNKGALAGFLIVGVNKAEREIERHFADAGNNIVKELAN